MKNALISFVVVLVGVGVLVYALRPGGQAAQPPGGVVQRPSEEAPAPEGGPSPPAPAGSEPTPWGEPPAAPTTPEDPSETARAPGLNAPASDELRRVAVDPSVALRARPLYAYEDDSGQFREPPEGSGTVHPMAVVATLDVSGGRLDVAIDADNADAKQPNLVRIDPAGRKSFEDAPAMPLKIEDSQEDYLQASFGPADVDFTIDGRTVPVRVLGQYQRWGNENRYVYLSLGTAIEGPCAFGSESRVVRIVDGNANLRCDDRAIRTAAGAYGGGGVDVSPGDTLLIASADGSFDTGPIKAFYGQPVCVGDAWYDVRASDSGITAERADVKAGQISVPHELWTGLLIGEKHLVSVSGEGKPIPVPADTYVLSDFAQFGKETSGGKRASLTCGRAEVWRGTAPKLEVKPGQTLVIETGTPLRATVIGSQGRARDQVTLTMEIKDVAGRSVDSIYTAEGARPPEPTIAIFDADDKQVHSAKLEYG